MLDIHGAYRQAQELEQAGGKSPHIKLAVWTAILSANNSIDRNGRQARLLAPLADKQDVTEGMLRKALRQENYVSRNHIGYLLGAQALWEAGYLDAFLIQPSNWQEWLHWRDSLVEMVKGLGYKTASMVAMLLWPTECPFAVIDRHVMSRLGIVNSKGNQPGGLTRKQYLAWEQYIAGEAKQAACPYNLCTWHWFKWEEWRQVNAHTIHKTGDYETHAPLSCRWY